MRDVSAPSASELIPRSNRGRRIDEDVAVRRLPSATLVRRHRVDRPRARSPIRHVGHGGQLALGIATAGVLAALLALHPKTVRLQTLAVVGIATLGEVVGSLVWGLYHYRLDNLPAFVPPGHGLVYLGGLSLATLLARALGRCS